ncbi:hypothetical protein HanIR_Chr04g0204291 [Helianthus annuus]|nr:hypothetical protein HanIR_Chr04g0204291 [Helianthus annuus]
MMFYWVTCELIVHSQSCLLGLHVLKSLFIYFFNNLFLPMKFDLCHFLNTEIMVLLDCVHMIWIIAFMVYTN